MAPTALALLFDSTAFFILGLHSNILASGARDGSISIWDVRCSTLRENLKSPGDAACSAYVSKPIYCFSEGGLGRDKSHSVTCDNFLDGNILISGRS